MTASRIAAACLAAAALTATGADAARAADPYCARQRGEIAGNKYARVWHSGRSLRGCSRYGGERRIIRRLGPWAPGSKVVLDGRSVAWTVPLTRDGVRSDRVWHSEIQGGRTLAGALAVPARGAEPEREARVQRLVVVFQTVGWTTTTGDVAMSLPEAGDTPSAIGALPEAPRAVGDRLRVASLPDVDPVALGASLRLEAQDGDGDDCASVTPYELTVDPGTGKRIGVNWADYVVRPEC